MQVNTNTSQNPTSSVKFDKAEEKKKDKLGRLNKSQRTADLFNNTLDNNDSKNPSKLKISFAMQSLNDELKLMVQDFLKKNPSINKILEQTELPHLEESNTHSSSSSIMMRKLSSYYQWISLGLHTQTEEVKTDLELSFFAVHEHGKDDEIQSIFSTFHESVKKTLEERKYHSPSYYYQLFPETYAFN